MCFLRVADLLKILCKFREIGASIQFTMHHGMQMFPSNRAKQRRWLQKASNKELSTIQGENITRIDVLAGLQFFKDLKKEEKCINSTFP